MPMPLDSALLERALKRARRRLTAAHQDAERLSTAPVLRAEAEALKTVTSRVRPHDQEVQVIDYTTAPPSERRIQLVAGVPLLKQIEQRFRLAKRLEGAEEKVLQRLADVEEQVALLQQALAADPALPFSASMRAALERLLPAAPAQRSRSDGASPALPYRTYWSASGKAIWVGTGAAKNDALTFKHASPHAAWFHATGFAGAHVVVPKRRGERLDPDTAHDAALLAAHFSKAPSGFVEVAMTEVKFVRKPRGAKAGAVILSREEQRRVDHDPAAVKLILARRAATKE